MIQIFFNLEFTQKNDDETIEIINYLTEINIFTINIFLKTTIGLETGCFEFFHKNYIFKFQTF